MLHEETVEAGTLALIKKLSGDPVLKDFALVGGTALALELGHRKSIDIDLFTRTAFDGRAVAEHLEAGYGANDVAVLGNAAFTRVNGVKVDLLTHNYPWLKPVIETDGIRRASLDDIAAMKLHAIVNDGTRLKDYYDVYYLLEGRNLQEMLDAYSVKYADGNPAIARNALLYHKEIDFKVGIDMMRPGVKWQEVVKRLREGVMETKKVFGQRTIERLEEQALEQGRKLRRRGRRR